MNHKPKNKELFLSIIIQKPYKPLKIKLSMGNTIVKIKLMPTSTEVDLKKIKLKAETIIKKSHGTLGETKQEPIAFGLIALILTFLIPESQELDPIEKALSAIKDVSSAQIIDMRREFG